jgi:hypothetical protein
MNKLIVFLAFLAIATNAQADKLIGSWENQTNEGWQDHPASELCFWCGDVYVDDTEVMPSRYTFSDDWSSHGNISLKANVTGWDWFTKIDVHTDLYNYSKIEFDIFAVAQDGSEATYAQIQQMVYSSQSNGWISLANSGFNTTLGGPATHCVLDYSAIKVAGQTSPTDVSGSFIFALNADAPVWFYMDNVILTGIPEPATLSLLGLGGIALLRRRK